jgi:hypothetical protein
VVQGADVIAKGILPLLSRLAFNPIVSHLEPARFGQDVDV